MAQRVFCCSSIYANRNGCNRHDGSFHTPFEHRINNFILYIARYENLQAPYSQEDARTILHTCPYAVEVESQNGDGWLDRATSRYFIPIDQGSFGVIDEIDTRALREMDMHYVGAYLKFNCCEHEEKTYVCSIYERALGHSRHQKEEEQGTQTNGMESHFEID